MDMYELEMKMINPQLDREIAKYSSRTEQEVHTWYKEEILWISWDTDCSWTTKITEYINSRKCTTNYAVPQASS